MHFYTGEKVADALTQGFARPKFRYFCEKMCVLDLFELYTCYVDVFFGHMSICIYIVSF